MYLFLMSIHMVTMEKLQVTLHAPAYNFVIRDRLVSTQHSSHKTILIFKLHVLFPCFNHLFQIFFLYFPQLFFLVLMLLGLTMLLIELLAKKADDAGLALEFSFHAVIRRCY